MIDIHTHILPGLDDGAGTLEDALGMVRMAAEAGSTDVVATPHFSEVFRFDPERAERTIGDLRAAAGDSIRIHYGCELHLTPEGIESVLNAPGLYTIAHRSYLLVEFSDALVPVTSGQIFARMLRLGVCPIIAHPERNPILQTRQAELQSWVAQGCRIQVTGQSLLGRFGRRAEAAALEWLRLSAVHFVASDAHDLRHRPAILDEPRRFVEKSFGSAVARRLFVENPQAVLDGTAIESPPPGKPKRRWFSLR